MARKPWKCGVCHRKASIKVTTVEWEHHYCWKHFNEYIHKPYPYIYTISVRPNTKANMARLEDMIEGVFA